MTQELAEPVAVRDLQVGQHVLCYEGGLDMSTPGSSAWCEVKNFFLSDDGTVYPDMVRLTVRAVDDSVSTTTVVSWGHLMHLVTDSAPRQQAATPGERELPEPHGTCHTLWTCIALTLQASSVLSLAWSQHS